MRKLYEKLMRIMEDKADDMLRPHTPETQKYNREHSKAREWEGELEVNSYGVCSITLVDTLDIPDFKKILESGSYRIKRTTSGDSWGLIEDGDGELLASIDNMEYMETEYDNLTIDWAHNA